jgi:hypothetical protein
LAYFTRLLNELGRTDQLIELFQKGWESYKATKEGLRYGNELFCKYIQKFDFNLQKQVY